MDLTVWLGLLASALFISISPGPGAIFSISQGTQYGFKRSLFSVVGLQFGLISQIIFLLFGLGVLIDQFPAIFKVIKAIGMLYLIVLGIMQWLKKIEQISTSKEVLLSSFSPLKEEKIFFGNKEIQFEIDSFKKKCLLEGLDDVALSLEKVEKIFSFENNLKNKKPWIFND